jgi:peptidoglycan hydrolase-like protein with peptidoglycan-binding domain
MKEETIMANYNQVSYGSKGSDVTELQKLLNQNGYKLTEDGIFGKNTQAAVKDYQQKNSLSVDGIVGKNTWGALTKAQTDSAGTTTPEATAPTFEYKPYQPSETVAQAEALLKQHLAQRPGEYQSAWQTQLNDTLQKILNREKFSYDLNGDALYQQYKDQYTTQGKMAMMDTMGHAAAMTGGYGNSYAQSVGQQAYQGYLQQLNNKIPELYKLALSQYNTEGNAMYNQASLMAQMEGQDYGRYRDQMSDYNTELARLMEDARYHAEQDYGKWADAQGFGYKQYRDQVGDKQWQAKFDEAKRQYDEKMALSKKTSSNPKRVVDEDKVEDEPVEETSDFKWVGQKLNDYIEGGASKSEAINFLTSCMQAGYITKDQYTSLKSTFVTR